MSKKKKTKKLYHIEIWEVDDDVELSNLYTHRALKVVEDFGKGKMLCESTQETYCPKNGGGELSCIVRQNAQVKI